jgi:tRNA(Ile)-lysidine synthase
LLSAWAEVIRVDLPVLTAHTMDDQAETVLMRLARGSGAEGLSGIHPFHVRTGRMWCRPLLGIRRAELRDWLRSNAIPWVEDPSNDDRSFDRIKARQALATLEPLGITVEGLAATATRLQRQSDVLRAEADRLARSIVRNDGPGGLVADRDLLRAAHPDTAMRWLAEGLMQVGGTVYRPRFRSLEPLYRRITSGEDLRATLAGCLIEAQKSEIRIIPEPK